MNLHSPEIRRAGVGPSNPKFTAASWPWLEANGRLFPFPDRTIRFLANLPSVIARSARLRVVSGSSG